MKFFALIIGFWSCAYSQSFTADGPQFLLNGKPFQIISGEMHYSRIPREYWRDRLVKAKCMGLNTVSTYMFWNVHEPRPGRFDFSGMADVAAFVRTAQEVGLYVILRPGPYACAEWEFGGFPSWLLKEHDLVVRSRDERFLRYSEEYIRHVGEELTSLQITRGGPIIMVQVENEYGSYGKDTLYEGSVRNMIRHAGFEVPLFTADGPSQMPNAYLPDVLPAVNGATGEEVFRAVKRFRPNGPFFVPEFYPGWLDHWGEKHSVVDGAESARELDWLLAHGISVSLYMFHGGTNFGFMNGANFGGRFQPQPTSYDYDAPLDETGRPTPKYFAFRDVLKKYSPTREIPPQNPPVRIPKVPLRESVSLFDGLPQPFTSKNLLSMEDVGQSYGFILYRTAVDSPGELVIKGLRDYCTVFLNRDEIGVLDRRYKFKPLALKTSGTLDVLVENGGRINYGREMLDNRKGIEKITVNGREFVNWQIFSLPMDSLNSLRWTQTSERSGPRFYRGKFSLARAGDGFLDMHGWNKGCAWVNGHPLGRYWYVGPQQTLYVPGPWLKQGENDLVVFESGAAKQSVEGAQGAVLDELVPDRLKPPLPHRVSGTLRLDSHDVAAEGFLGDSLQSVAFSPRPARFACLQSLSSLAHDHFASIAEFYLLDSAGHALPREKWSVFTVDSEELDAEDGHAENAFDDDSHTIWHTEWGKSKPDHPHAIAIDLGESRNVAGFRYLPRQEDAPGKIKSYRFYLRKNEFELTK